MIYNKMSRRMFLRGAGNTIFAIPFLPSLLPREAWAQAATCMNPPVRFLSLASQFGPTPALWVGNLTGNSRKAENVNVRSLTEWLASNSTMSPVFGSDFNPVARKMAIIRGLDFYCSLANNFPEPFHNYTAGSCATPQFFKDPMADLNNPANPPARNMSSIDYIIANSSVNKPAHISSAYRLISCAPTSEFTVWPDWGGLQNGTWMKGSTTATYEGVIRRGNTQNLYNFMISAFSNNTTTPQQLPSTSSAEHDIVQSVYDEYKSIRDSSQISSVDKYNLESFMALISDLMKNLGTPSEPQPQPISCNKPSSTFARSDNDNDGRFRNHVDLLVAAMACDLNRVAALQVNTLRKSAQGEMIHHYHHLISGNKGAPSGAINAKQDYESNWIASGKNVAYLLNKMNSIQDPAGGTLLDNSIVYWWCQHGLSQDTGVSHQAGDHGVMVAGGGNGALEMGYFIDYRHQSEKFSNRTAMGSSPGLPINNLLMTFLNAFKVPASEYEQPGEPGFGAYWNPSSSKWLWGLSVMSEGYRNKILAMRRESLPFLYKKPAC